MDQRHIIFDHIFRGVDIFSKFVMVNQFIAKKIKITRSNLIVLFYCSSLQKQVMNQEILRSNPQGLRNVS